MSALQWTLEIVLVALLGATLFFALRLERTIGVLRKDRVGLGEVLSVIRVALDDAERGIQALQNTAEITGRILNGEIAAAGQAQQDLGYLLERLETVAEKVEVAIKSGRSVVQPEEARPAQLQSKAERDLLKVLRLSK